MKTLQQSKIIFLTLLLPPINTIDSALKKGKYSCFDKNINELKLSAMPMQSKEVFVVGFERQTTFSQLKGLLQSEGLKLCGGSANYLLSIMCKHHEKDLESLIGRRDIIAADSVSSFMDEGDSCFLGVFRDRKNIRELFYVRTNALFSDDCLFLAEKL